MDAPRTSSIFDRFEAPPSAKLLGWTLRVIDPDAGTIEIGFTTDDRFTNPGGTVQGGFLAAMLDDGLAIQFERAKHRLDQRGRIERPQAQRVAGLVVQAGTFERQLDVPDVLGAAARGDALDQRMLAKG